MYKKQWLTVNTSTRSPDKMCLTSSPHTTSLIHNMHEQKVLLIAFILSPTNASICSKLKSASAKSLCTNFFERNVQQPMCYGTVLEFSNLVSKTNLPKKKIKVDFIRKIIFKNNFQTKNRDFQNYPIKRARRASRPKIIIKTSKNDQIEVVGHNFLNAL